MDTIHIAYDSREQKPLHQIERHASTDVVYHRAALDTFDYCVWRDWAETKGETVRPYFAIERKSVADFIGSWFNAENKRRELEKIERAGKWRPRPTIYVLEGNVTDIGKYDYCRWFPSGKVQANSVEAVIDRLRYAGVQVIMNENAYMAEYVILSLLKRRIKSKSVRHWRALWEDENDTTRNESVQNGHRTQPHTE